MWEARPARAHPSGGSMPPSGARNRPSGVGPEESGSFQTVFSGALRGPSTEGSWRLPWGVSRGAPHPSLGHIPGPHTRLRGAEGPVDRSPEARSPVRSSEVLARTEEQGGGTSAATCPLGAGLPSST